MLREFSYEQLPKATSASWSFKKILPFFLLILLLLIYLFVDINETKVSFFHFRTIESVNRTRYPTKYILYWTKMFSREDFYYGLESTPFQDCEYKNCFTTANESFLEVDRFDALIFHGPLYNLHKDSVPSRRSVSQRYVFANLEAPVNLPGMLKPFKNFYNWTLTYRTDSDIPNPYGYFVKHKAGYDIRGEELMKSKTNLIAWFVSNCRARSGRNEIVNKMKTFVDIDVYGKCGNLSCTQDDPACYELLEKNYKFYLSFENSYCKDYVTEKLFTILQYDVVPIVFGYVDYARITPSHSVINVEDFKSIKDLISYLNYLNENDNEYLEYFKWKSDYYVVSSIQKGMCDLCKKLSTDFTPKVYESIEDWWWGIEKPICKTDKALPKIVYS